MNPESLAKLPPAERAAEFRRLAANARALLFPDIAHQWDCRAEQALAEGDTAALLEGLVP